MRKLLCGQGGSLTPKVHDATHFLLAPAQVAHPDPNDLWYNSRRSHLFGSGSAWMQGSYCWSVAAARWGRSGAGVLRRFSLCAGDIFPTPAPPRHPNPTSHLPTPDPTPSPVLSSANVRPIGSPLLPSFDTLASPLPHTKPSASSSRPPDALAVPDTTPRPFERARGSWPGLEPLPTPQASPTPSMSLARLPASSAEPHLPSAPHGKAKAGDIFVDNDGVPLKVFIQLGSPSRDALITAIEAAAA